MKSTKQFFKQSLIAQETGYKEPKHWEYNFDKLYRMVDRMNGTRWAMRKPQEVKHDGKVIRGRNSSLKKNGGRVPESKRPQFLNDTLREKVRLIK